MIQYRNLERQEICQELFYDFLRHQVVTKCWRKENDKWVIKEVPFIDDWKEDDYQYLVSCLKKAIKTGCFVQ